MPKCSRQSRGHRLKQGHIMTPSPAVSPRVSFLVHLLLFLVQHGHWSPFFEVFPCTIYLLSSSNNGSTGFAPQTTTKLRSLSKDILFVVDLGHIESFERVILAATGCKTSGSICSDNLKLGTHRKRSVGPALYWSRALPRPSPHPPPPCWPWESTCNVLST